MDTNPSKSIAMTPEEQRARWCVAAKAQRDKDREAHNAKKRAYRAANLDSIRIWERSYKDTNRDHSNDKRRARYAASPEIREKARRAYLAIDAQTKARYYATEIAKYAAAHPNMRVDRPIAERRKWKTEKIKQWMLTHPERAKSITHIKSHNRRARKLAAFIESVDPSVVFARDKGICCVCKRKVTATQKWHVDHWVPLAGQGLHCYENVGVAHGKCNQKKGAKMPKGQLGLFQRKVA